MIERVREACNRLGCTRYKILIHTVTNTNFIFNNTDEITQKSFINEITLYIEYNNKLGVVKNEFNCNFDVDWLVSKAIYDSCINDINYIDFDFKSVNYIDKCFSPESDIKILKLIQDKKNLVESHKNYQIDYINYSYKLTNTVVYFDDNNTYCDSNYINMINIYGSNLKLKTPINIRQFNISDNLDLLNLIQKYNDAYTIKPNTLYPLKGMIRFSYNVMAKMISLISNIFNARNILSDRVFITKYDINKYIFCNEIDIIDDPLCKSSNMYLCDHEGVKCSKKYLIKHGILQDVLNNEKTKLLLQGTTSGNCFFDYANNDLAIQPTNLILNINKTYEYEYDIYISDININESIFDFQSGHFTLKLIGKYKNSKKFKYFSFDYNIKKFINNINPASSGKWINNIYVPEVYLKV
ncbi:metallopeptidase TldD-related protein (plasmid) [Clostridium sp. FAM 1755]|uniref:metallopeptidase TldD-related protein n=1 Tax=Clostridium TaxID=1485 RepID=UPI0013D3E562|nr:metallopeptidase TldD-related protein [Clostridium sporogenes]NFV14537.1 hypothetical protein [Clostridium sporogenes]